jgi:predicted enzyme related to lactoylglutathione lyase
VTTTQAFARTRALGPYVQVEDLDVAVDKAVSLGATVVAGKADGPAGTAVTIADPGGALVALWTPFPDKT